MIEFIYDQGSREWHEIRLGRFTGSGIADLFTKPRSKEETISQTRHTYLLKKIGEISTGMTADQASGMAVDWGHEHEPLARLWYERKTYNIVWPAGFMTLSDGMEYVGASPDGLTEEKGEPGGVEIKCPFVTANHLEHCLIDSPEYFKKHFKDYYYQCMIGMMVTGSKFWDFISFDPRMKNDAGLFIFRLHKNVDEFKEILAVCIEARAQMECIAAKLKIAI